MPPPAGDVAACLDPAPRGDPDAKTNAMRLVELEILAGGDPSMTSRYFFSRAIFDVALGMPEPGLRYQ